MASSKNLTISSIADLPTTKRPLLEIPEYDIRVSSSEGSREWLLRELIIVRESGLSSRILEYLATEKYAEPDVWLRDDVHLAFLIVLFAARGYENPFQLAYCNYFGAQPEKVIRELCRRAEYRSSLGPTLADELAAYESLPPKKPSISVGRQSLKKESA